jgi:hypothetical protein
MSKASEGGNVKRHPTVNQTRGTRDSNSVGATSHQTAKAFENSLNELKNIIKPADWYNIPPAIQAAVEQLSSKLMANMRSTFDLEKLLNENDKLYRRDFKK